MFINKPLNLFYSEPDPDRWIKYDRYPRKIIRRLIRGKERPGGVAMIAANLIKGLNNLGISHRLNDYDYITKNPDEIACIIGKPHVLFERSWNNPIIFGAGVYSHPIECPDLFIRYPHVKRLLVPGDWMKKMFEPFYSDKVALWPVGIDSAYWQVNTGNKTFDFLIYDKLNRDRNNLLVKVLDPIIKVLSERNYTYHIVRYGQYTPEILRQMLDNSNAAIFLSESETQGMAYQQILSTNTPILAWDRGGYWQDPYYYPHKVKYQPVSSVPYWDERCGLKFTGAGDFEEQLNVFLIKYDEFKPRDYVMENLTLEICAEKYLQIYSEVEREIA